MAFTAIKSLVFQQIFKDLPGITLLFIYRKVLTRRIDSKFIRYREQLVKSLDETYQIIAISLDVWTSKNSKPILGVIGHQLDSQFYYQEQVLEFAEIYRAYTGENIADLLQRTLEELRIERKILVITADNASNNKALVLELYLNLSEKFQSDKISTRETTGFRFQGADSYIRCLAYIFNLIVSEILSTLKSGDYKAVVVACNLLQENKDIGIYSVLSRLRIMALWILRIPQRRQQWKVICQTNRLNDKFIEYNIDIRWNSTFRIIQDTLQAKQQIKKQIDSQTYLPPFINEDWDYLQQIESILIKFEEFTLTISKRQPQISLAIPIYYELCDILNDAASYKGEFSGLSLDIASAVSLGLIKFKKYYSLIDRQDTYYIALVLDPRFKTLLLERDLGKMAASEVIQYIKECLHKQYQSPHKDLAEQNSRNKRATRTIEARILQKLQPLSQRLSDIDRYFNEGVVIAQDTMIQDKEWLLSWWRTHYHKYPCAAAATRDYLAIPASEVAVERLFNSGRDLLGLRRHSLNRETIRQLVLLRDAYKSEGKMYIT